jgi:AraC-like DNA-binding protein
MERSATRGRIGALANYTGLSQSALERRFRRVVGVSPKKFASILQLRRAVALLSDGKNHTEAALQAGYFDQAHFINAFHRATGTSPTRLLQSGRNE